MYLDHPQLALRQIYQLDLLDGHSLSGAPIERLVDRPERSLANAVAQPEVLQPRVLHRPLPGVGVAAAAAAAAARLLPRWGAGHLGRHDGASPAAAALPMVWPLGGRVRGATCGRHAVRGPGSAAPDREFSCCDSREWTCRRVGLEESGVS